MVLAGEHFRAKYNLAQLYEKSELTIGALYASTQYEKDMLLLMEAVKTFQLAQHVCNFATFRYYVSSKHIIR